MKVKSGSAIVNIYRVENKGRDSFKISYFADGNRKQKMFADFDQEQCTVNGRGVLQILQGAPGSS